MLIAPKKNSSMSKVKQEKFPILQQILASPHLWAVAGLDASDVTS